MTEGEATAPAGQGRNLLMRVAAAAVLAPAAIAIAYAGGWWWTALVTLAATGRAFTNVSCETAVTALFTCWLAYVIRVLFILLLVMFVVLLFITVVL